MTKLSDERIALLPCPFCGGEAMQPQRSTLARNIWFVACRLCDARQTGIAGKNPEMGKQSAIRSWNRRPSPASGLPDGGGEPVAWVTADILATMKRGERVVPGWKRSADFCIPLYAVEPGREGWRDAATAKALATPYVDDGEDYPIVAQARRITDAVLTAASYRDAYLAVERLLPSAPPASNEEMRRG